MKARERAQGRWKSVLTSLGIPAEALTGKHTRCPKDNSGKDRFRFADREGTGSYFCQCSDGSKGGIALLQCCKNLSYAEAAREVESVVGGAVENKVAPKKDPLPLLRKIQERLQPAGEAVTGYLAARKLFTPPTIKQIRWQYWDGTASIGEFDVMACRAIGSDGVPLTFHLTYLSGGKKAEVPSPRKIMTPIRPLLHGGGAAVRLFPAEAEMGIAEGIETALAASQMFDIPVWAAINKASLKEFVPPECCKTLHIFGDCDESYAGQAAAYQLAERMVRQHITTSVMIPRDVGDWNDELQKRGAKTGDYGKLYAGRTGGPQP